MAPAPPSPEALLGEADFVRALARSLLADHAAADDVAQEALVAGLERPPAVSGALRGWLASVVRNLVRLQRRGEARREEREQRVARAERAPSTVEVVEREAARAAVVHAVLALDEPYRTVVLLRFYEGATPRAIAAGLGIPVETVHTRTKRALAQLRARLDADFGARPTWAALLFPLARPAPSAEGALAPSTPSRTIAMLSPKLLVASLPLVVLGLSWLGLRSSRSGFAPATGPAMEFGTAEVEPWPARETEPEVAARGREVVPRPGEALTTATLRLNISWSDGTPAAGVHVRVADVGRPSYSALEGRTEGSGACTFTGLRAGRATVQLDRKARSDSATLLAGEETVLALQIPRGFDVDGMVRSADGRAVTGATIWMGRSYPPYFPVATSAADGTFHVRSLQTKVSLWARRDGHAPSLARCFRHPEGAVVQETFELRGEGATVSGRVLDEEDRPIANAQVLVDGQGMLREEDPGLPLGMVGIAYAFDSVRGAHAGPVWVRTDGSGHFTVGGVRPGTVPIGVLAAGHAPWRGSVEAAAGASASTEIHLSRGWSLTGRVLDPEGNPTPARLWVYHARVPGMLCPSAEIGSDGSFELSDLAPGKLSLWIQNSLGVARTTLDGTAGAAITWEGKLGPEPEDGLETDPWDE